MDWLAQNAPSIIGGVLSVLVAVLLWQLKAWVRGQNALREQMQVLGGEMSALRLQMVEGQAAAQKENRKEIAGAIKEHRETCRAAQDATTGVRGHPSGRWPVTG